jgi:hypothetical protein
MSSLSFNAHLVRADLAHQAADVVPGGSPREVINGYGRKAKRKSDGNGNGMGGNPVKEWTKGTWLIPRPS